MLGLLDKWFPNQWETGKVFDLFKGHTNVLRESPPGGPVSPARRALLDRSICFAVYRSFFFAVDQLLSMDEARARFFRSNGAPSLSSDAMSDDSHDGQLTPNLDDDDSNYCDFPDEPVDSHIDVRAGLRQEIDAIREICCSANVTVH